jgi:hypothetical protein
LTPAPFLFQESTQMTYRLIALIGSLGCLSAAMSPRPAANRIEQVRWLTGCWELKDARRTIQENWMAPLGNTMVNTGRTVRGDSLAEFELVVIRAGREKLTYEPHPSDQPPTVFVEVELTDHSVLFENKAHDFPQQVGYERRGADSLLAWIAGSIDGNTRRVKFPYARVRCS